MHKQNKMSLRRQAMLEHIASNPITTPGQLVECFGVSTETIRKDLDALVLEGLIHKVHGGVVILEQQNAEKSHDLRSVEHIEEKKRIALAARDLIEPGDAIILENGTTVMELARCLKDRPELLKSILVITMSFRIADILKDCEGIQMFFLGGWLRQGDLMAYGQSTMNILREFNADKAFIGSAGLNEKLSVTDYFDEEVAMRKQIIDNTKHTILLMDSSKLYKTKLLNVCKLADIKRLICDVGCDQKMKYLIEKEGVTMTLV